MLTFMLTCVTCTCYVTSRVLGWVGVGCVNVRYMHMLRHVLGSGEWGVLLMFMLTCVTRTCWHQNCRMRTDVDTDVKQEQNLVTCRR